MIDPTKIVTGVRAMPITEALYALKEQGKHPMARVSVDSNGRVQQVQLDIGGVRYYFHSTKDRNGKRLGVEATSHEGGKTFTVPFDGWEASPDLFQAKH